MKPQRKKYWEEFKDHTLFKHFVLECYASAWMQKVVRGRAAREVVVVDAFAGMGGDQVGNPGSPVRLARAAAIAGAKLAADLGIPVPVHVIAIELKPQWCAALAAYMRPFGSTVEVLEGTLRDHLPRILDEHGSNPTLFFLDPFGLKGLEADLVSRALAGEAREALVLFNDPGADRLAGAAGGHDEAESGVQGSLFGPSASEEIESPVAGELAEPSWGESGASREILERAFGGNAWELALGGVTGGPARRTALIRSYETLLQSMGARYTTRIPVCNARGEREYTLVHASKSPHGRLTMKQEALRALRLCDLPERVKTIIQGQLRTDLEGAILGLWEVFGGQEVFWSEDHVPSIKAHLLQETEMFPHQLDEVRGRLKGSKVPGRGPHRYRFR